MFQGRKILLGITGGIAAYKSILLVRFLVKNGAEVKVILTPSAKKFVSELTLSTLSKNKVLVDLFDDGTWSNHVELGRWAEIMIIAPLTCNTLSKMAHGICDNLLMAVYLSATCPVIVAPAMDEDMWHHASIKKNISTIESYGNKIIPVNSGELASGLFGEGRMAEPEEIVNYISSFLNSKQLLKGKKVLVNAGPTYEQIDPVRFIGNHSSGKMGIAIAEELYLQGAQVHLVLGPSNFKPLYSEIQLTHVTSSDQMFDECVKEFVNVDIAILSAAVADYKAASISSQKIKKKDDNLLIELSKTKDILKHLGAIKTENQILVGFALETQNEEAYATKKLKEKNADIIVLNSLNDLTAGFGKDTNKVTIFERNGNKTTYPSKSKKEVAKDIVQHIIQAINDK
jgi:phosphopantothenoylcysteine decarboxylase/phosphopantothenate--cysteine ligase